MRSPLQLVGEAVTDLRDVAVGWHWGQRRPAPRSADQELLALPASIPADWPRRLPVRIARRLLQAAIRPLLQAELQLDVGSRAEIAETSGPIVLVANHASQLDIPVLLAALPPAQRRRTGVAVTGDDFGDSDWRAATSAVVFNTSRRSVPGATPGELLDAGWNVLMFPEGSRSADGVIGAFGTEAAELAQAHRAAVLPIGIRGTYAAMPRGQAWPGGRPFAHDRHRVAVRFGPLLRAQPEETAASFTERIAGSVRTAINEDRTTWWQSRRGSESTTAGQAPVGSWRRIWEQSQSPVPGGLPRRPRIWRR